MPSDKKLTRQQIEEWVASQSEDDLAAALEPYANTPIGLSDDALGTGGTKPTLSSVGGEDDDSGLTIGTALGNLAESDDLPPGLVSTITGQDDG